MRRHLERDRERRRSQERRVMTTESSFQSCPEVRVRAVTEPSPKAVFRHIDIHGPPPRDRLESSAIRVPRRNVNHRKESVMKQKSTKRVALVGFMLAALCASSSFADVRWRSIVGVITAPDDLTTDAAENINNPVGKVSSGTFPWSVRAGRARVDLATGRTSFEVHGLVINGQTFSGTPGPVTAVTGTVVCNAGGGPSEAELDTSDVPIDGVGDARFSGMIQGIPATCSNPLFLVRIATIANPDNPNGARGRWIATGTERSTRP